MLAYAPNNRVGARAGSLRTLVLVLAGHAALLALVLTARGEMPGIKDLTETEVIFVEPVKPPPPPPQPTPPRSDTRSRIDTPPSIVPLPQPALPPLDTGPPLRDTTPAIGTAVVPVPLPLDPPTPVVVRKAARFITPADDIRPPYPASKQRLEEEATLRLALEIDSRGRVVSVDPVGTADPVFLDAARRHILRRWRYQPATNGGVAVDARITVTLKFELDE